MRLKQWKYSLPVPPNTDAQIDVSYYSSFDTPGPARTIMFSNIYIFNKKFCVDTPSALMSHLKKLASCK